MERFEVIQLLKLYKNCNAELRMLKELDLSEEQKQEEAALLQQLKRDISAAATRLEHVQKDAIWSHYIQGQKWVAVGRKHCYSERQIRNISNNGLIALGKLLDQSETACQFLQRTTGNHTS